MTPDERSQLNADTPMTRDEIEAAQARCDAATPGEWKHNEHSGDGRRQYVNSTNVDTWNCLRAEVDSYDCDYDTAVANAKFIAHARTDLPRALATIRELQAKHDGMREEVFAIREALYRCNCEPCDIEDLRERYDRAVAACIALKSVAVALYEAEIVSKFHPEHVAGIVDPILAEAEAAKKEG